MEHRVPAAIQIPDFRLLLLGRLLVTLPLQIEGMAVGWQIYALTKSALFLGFAGLAEAIPAITIALYAGHVADIVDRRTIALSTVAMLVACLAALSLCSAHFAETNLLVWVIFAVIAFTGFARGFYGPAIFGMLSDIVPRPLYGNAAAWNSAVWQACALAGPI